MGLIVIAIFIIMFLYLGLYMIMATIEVRLPVGHPLKKWWRKIVSDVDSKESKNGGGIY